MGVESTPLFVFRKGGRIMATTILQSYLAYEVSLDMSKVSAYVASKIRQDDYVYFITNSITINGQTYALSDRPNARCISVSIWQIIHDGYKWQTASIRYLDGRGVAIGSTIDISDTNMVVGSVYATSTFVTDDTYVSVMQATRKSPITISVNITNATITNFEPSTYQREWGAPSYDSRFPILAEFTANEGYTFTSSNPLAVSGLVNLSDAFSIQNNLLTFNAANTSEHYFFDNVVFTINAYATYPLNVTNDLTHVSNSSTSTSINYGAPYIGTLTPDSGYFIGSVIVMMGSSNITRDVYNPTTGVINISSVTEDLSITAIARSDLSVTNQLTGCTSSNSATTIGMNEPYSAVITPNSGYSLEDASVLITIDGVEQYNVYSNGVINIPSVTGDLVITIIATTIKTFTFKSMDGNTTYLTLNLVKIRTIKLTINGNTRTLRVNGQDYSWVNIMPTGKELSGLALTSNATRIVIPVNIEVNVNYDESMTFYEVIVDEQPLVQTFSLLLYKNSAEINRVDKSNYLQYVSTLDGTLKAYASILAPQITIEYDGVINFNYVYIPIWNRYYFVTNIQYGVKNLITLTLKVDVLMSHKDAIYSQHGLVARNENEYNEQLIDNERIVNDNPIIDVVESSQSVFDADARDNIVVNYIGG